MKTQFRVLMTDRAWPDAEVERAILADAGAELIEATAADETTLAELARDVDAIGTTWARVTERVIRSCTNCKIVARFGIGLDNIDVRVATELGIPVTNCPDYCVSEVSDHALGLLLACARQIGFFHWRTKQGEYNLGAATTMRRLSSQTVGIIGLGHTARELVPKLRAIGFHVLAHTRSGNAYGTDCQMVSLDELLTQSDYVSLHAPLTPETHHLINAERLCLMKPTAYIINTSRGGLIDATALWNAIHANKLAGAALDVFEPEPPNLTLPLYRDERVIITPHVAFVSAESLEQLRRQATNQIVQALRGQRLDNVVNPGFERETKFRQF